MFVSFSFCWKFSRILFPSPSPFHCTDLSITILLTEAQRVRGIEISGTSGGDGIAVVLDALVGAVVDMAGNPSEAHLNLAVSETQDSILPTITSAEIFLGTGVLQVTASETIDVTPTTYVIESGIVVDNGALPSGTALGLERWIRLEGAHVMQGDADGLIFTLQMTEQQRVHAIALSNTLGGDGVSTVLDVDASAVRDIAGNLVLEDADNVMTEHADGTTVSALRLPVCLHLSSEY